MYADTPVIVSLTSWPPRIASLPPVIDSLLQQTVPADRIILWLAEAQFPQRESAYYQNQQHQE